MNENKKDKFESNSYIFRKVVKFFYYTATFIGELQLKNCLLHYNGISA